MKRTLKQIDVEIQELKAKIWDLQIKKTKLKKILIFGCEHTKR